MTLPTATRHHWSQTKQDQADKEILVQEVPNLRYWHPLFEGADDRNRKMWKWLRQRVPASGATARDWHELRELGNWLGYLVPMFELDRLGPHVVRDVVEGLAHQQRYFAWNEYLEAVANEADRMSDHPIVLAGLWNYVLFYNAFLHTSRGHGVRLELVLQRMPDGDTFSNRLPSEQCLELLLQLCREPFAKYFNATEFEQLRAAAHPPVKTFFNENIRSLRRMLAGGTKMSTANTQVAGAFYDCCKEDLPFVEVQDSLDGWGAWDKNTKVRKAPAFTPTNVSFPLLDRLRNVVSRVGLLERIASVRPPAPAAAPRFGDPYEPLAPAKAQKWYGLPEAALARQLAQVSSPPTSNLHKRWEEQLRRCADHLMMPILHWGWTQKLVLPAWNFPDPAVGISARKAYEAEQVLIAEEMKRLDSLLYRLRTSSSLFHIKKVDEDMRFFKSAAVARHWEEAKLEQRRKLKHHDRYRQQRMEEFGISESGLSKFKNEVWLDEMLRVEEEVRPYMAYVRRAFQAALPVGTTIEFNPYPLPPPPRWHRV